MCILSFASEIEIISWKPTETFYSIHTVPGTESENKIISSEPLATFELKLYTVHTAWYHRN